MRMHDLIVPAGIPRWERFVKSLDWPSRRLGPKSTDERFLAGMLKSVDGVIVCNDHDKKKLHEKILPLLKANSCRLTIQMIPIGSNIPVVPISVLTRSRCRQDLGCSDRDVVLVYFGFIQEGKGAGDLLQVFDRIAAKYENTRLLILGAVPFWESHFGSQYQSLINRLEHRDRVVWKQYLPAEEVSVLLQCSDLALLPYRTGAVLNRGTLIACITHGLPVVTTQGTYPLGGPFVDGGNILLAAPDELDGISRKTGDLIDSLSLRSRISTGATRIAPYFNWSRIGRTHLEFYQSNQ